MAESVALFLKANGTDVQGESTVTSLGRENSIECLAFEFRVASSISQSVSGVATGRRRYEPIKIRKRIDKSSVLLFRALTLNQRIDAEFRFFRPNPSGDGTTEHFYTITITNGRVAGVAQAVRDVFKSETASDPELEDVTFIFQTIKTTYVNGGIEHEDTFSTSR
jgi:type VI secretion system secreted protein Hcp